jgi:hypothetical protein
MKDRRRVENDQKGHQNAPTKNESSIIENNLIVMSIIQEATITQKTGVNASVNENEKESAKEVQ